MASTFDSTKLGDQFLLADGTRARLRALVAGDRQLLEQMYTALSPASRYGRFLSTPPRLTEPILDHLINTVDQVDHVALVLLAPAGRPDEHAVGVGRIARYPDDPTSADMSLAVADAWQGRGAGSALARALLNHRPAGVNRLVTMIAAGNAASFAIMSELGTATRRPVDGGAFEVTIALPADQ
jgi:RimJ/RimL family protein N-acetyltransferase